MKPYNTIAVNTCKCQKRGFRDRLINGMFIVAVLVVLLVMLIGAFLQGIDLDINHYNATKFLKQVSIRFS